MLLTQEQLLSCLHGSLKPHITPLGMEPRRFTDSQFAYRTTEGQFSRMRAPVGVSFDFNSNATFLEFEYHLTYIHCRNWVGFDCYVNGNLCHRFYEEPITQQEGKVRFEFATSDEKHIAVYFPISVPLAVKNLTLSPHATLTPSPKKPKQVLMFGDSILQGMNARFSSLCLPVLLSQHWNCDILPQAMGGGSFGEHVIDENLPYTPDVIVIMFGCNDWYTFAKTNEEITENARAFAEKLDALYPDIPRYFISPIWSATWQKSRREGMCPYGEVHDYIQKGIASMKNTTLLRGFDLCPHHSSFLADGVHPNELGFQYYANQIAKAIQL